MESDRSNTSSRPGSAMSVDGEHNGQSSLVGSPLSNHSSPIPSPVAPMSPPYSNGGQSPNNSMSVDG